MFYILLLHGMVLFSSQMILCDFNDNCNTSNWQVVDDVVMGGRSKGAFDMNDEGHAVFQGDISLENNGGFSSVRYRPGRIPVSDYDKIVIRIKGDGKRYQFRIKSSVYDRHSYIAYFQTTGDWQDLEIPFSQMYPVFRGTRLSIPNYSGQRIEEIGFLISNKKAERFRLEIGSICLGGC